MNERTVLFDVDGTLADNSHRLHHIQNGKKDWVAFYKDVEKDIPIQPIIDLLYALEVSNRIVLCSGRPTDYFKQTLDWVQQHVGGDRVSAIYMRPSGDFRKDHVVKAELLDKIRDDGYLPWLVIDDRPSVVAMWRAKGIVCLQCRDWDEAPKVAPGPLTMMIGPSGAGKTTFLSAQIDKGDLDDRSVLSSDSLRQLICGDFKDQTQNARVFEYLHSLAVTTIKAGLPCVIDATNLKRADRMAILTLLPKDTPVTYVVIDRPMEEKILDAGWRPQWLLEKHAATFKSQLPDILTGDHLLNVTVKDLRR